MTFSFLIPWLPALTALLAIAIQELALPWSFWAILRPELSLICLFYWRLFRPDLCGPAVAFAAGLVIDIVSGVPLGLNTLTKVMLVLLVGHLGQRLRSTDFIFLVPIMALLVAMEELIQWGLVSLLQGGEMRWQLLMGRPLATALLTPLVIALLVRVHRSWVEAV